MSAPVDAPSRTARAPVVPHTAAAAGDLRVHAAVVHPAAPLGRRDRCLRGHGAVRSARSHAVDRNEASGFANVASEGIFGLMMPIATLIIGDAVLGAEVRAGTFHFSWRSPVSTWQLVVGRWLGGSLVALVTIVPATALSALVAGVPEAAGPALAASAVGSVSYVAIFVAIGCISRRTAVWALAFVFLIERLLGTALTGIAQLSPTWESRAIFVGLVDFDVPDRLIREGIPQGTGAIVRLLVVSVVALAVATWRMGHLRLGGASD